MGLESATYISQLVASNPLSTDKKKQGDDHIRLIKQVLQNTFPNADRAIVFQDSLSKVASYSVVDGDNGKTIFCDTSGGGFTLTLPTLGVGDDLWNIEVIKTTSDANPVWIAPPSGTINGFSKVRRAVEFEPTRVVWTGSTFVASRAFSVPIGSVVEFYGTTLPNGLLWPDGTTFVAADYVELNSKLGGNSKPDRRGRVAFGKDDMGGSTAGRITNAGSGVVGTTLGATGGAESVTLSTDNVPAHTHPQTAQQPTFTYLQRSDLQGGSGQTAVQNVSPSSSATPLETVGDTTPGNTGNNTTAGTAVNKLPPTIVANFGIVAE